jgi:hypothetical protein
LKNGQDTQGVIQPETWSYLVVTPDQPTKFILLSLVSTEQTPLAMFVQQDIVPSRQSYLAFSMNGTMLFDTTLANNVSSSTQWLIGLYNPESDLTKSASHYSISATLSNSTQLPPPPPLPAPPPLAGPPPPRKNQDGKVKAFTWTILIGSLATLATSIIFVVYWARASFQKMEEDSDDDLGIEEMPFQQSRIGGMQ